MTISPPTLDQLHEMARDYTADVSLLSVPPGSHGVCAESCLLVGSSLRGFSRYDLDKIEDAVAGMVVGSEFCEDDDLIYVLIEGQVPYRLVWDGQCLTCAPLRELERNLLI